ncbi:MAG: ABC-F family ATP-binding cassette domain-containing protein, partial [Planctomycetes bacterium]|nr:ABC-F family ATP-binding cassette domain-containing protein [Planctomycetota bacterium]
GSRIRVWPGSYGDYERQKAEALALQERQYKNQQRLIRRLEFQARRLRDMARAYDDPGQAKRAKSMLARIERMDIVEKPEREESVFHASFQGAPRHGELALSVQSYSKAFGDRVLFDQADLEIGFGQRVCLVGPNGSGKSTLFRDIIEQSSWENPDLRLGRSVRLGDYNQFHDAVLEAQSTVLDWLMGATRLDRTPASDLLYRFRFAREDLDRPVATLSGGEKSRLQLARLVHEKANFLMLDEPTNHLDIPSCEQLEEMLEEFEGTLLVVSHDRYFLDRLVDTVVEVRDRKLERFRGSFADWWEMRHAEGDGRAGGALRLHSQAQAAAEPTADREAHAARQVERKTRQREERRLRRDVERLEARVGEIEQELVRLQDGIAIAFGPDGDTTRGLELTRRLEALEAELETTMSAWEASASDLDAIRQGSAQD